MTSARKFESHLLTQAGGVWTQSHMDVAHRALQDAGLIVKAGHGINAPPISPLEAASLLLGLIAEKPADAAKAVEVYQGLRAVDGGGSLLDYLVYLLEDPKNPAEVDRITLSRTWPAVEVAKANGAHLLFRDVDHHPPAACCAITLRGSLLAALAGALKPADSGWTGWKPEDAE